MRFFQLYNAIHLLPAIDIGYDKYFEGGLIYLELNFTWLKWGVSLSLKKEK